MYEVTDSVSQITTNLDVTEFSYLLELYKLSTCSKIVSPHVPLETSTIYILPSNYQH